MALTTINRGAKATAVLFDQFRKMFIGEITNQPVSFTGLSDNAQWALTLRNKTTPGQHARVQHSTTGVDVVEITDAGLVVNGTITATGAINNGSTPVIDASLYGVKADGSFTDSSIGTDNTALIQAAITACPAAGGEVRLPAGIYRTTAEVLINKPMIFTGDGLNNTVIMVDSSTETGLHVTHGYANVRDITVKSTKAGRTGYGVYINGGAYQFYERVGSFGHGHAFHAGPTNAVAGGNVMRNCHGGSSTYGMYAIQASLYYSECQFNGNATDGMYLEGPMTGFNMYACTVVSNLSRGLNVVGTASGPVNVGVIDSCGFGESPYCIDLNSNHTGGGPGTVGGGVMLFTGCFIERATTSNVRTSDFSDVTVFDGCSITGAGVAGIEVLGKREMLSNCHIGGNVTAGIVTGASTNELILNNITLGSTVTAPQGYGLQINSTTNPIAITGGNWSEYSTAPITGTVPSKSLIVGAAGLPTVRPRKSLNLLNGTNSNIPIGWDCDIFTVTGPTGAFDIGGFTNALDGRRIVVLNSTTQQMTILNGDASSTSGQRISTQTSASVVLRAGTSNATFEYDASSGFWILVGYN